MQTLTVAMSLSACALPCQEGSEQAVPEFPDLLQSLYDGIEQLGGAVFPKLNWSAPLDAAWVNGGSLKCVTPGEVVTLLKSSLFASHDLAHAAGAVATNAPSEGAVTAADGIALVDGSDGVTHCNGCAAAEATATDAQEVDAPAQLQDPVQLTLVLRKWCNLLPAMVFRCFVAHGRILGVSQRDCTCHYAFLQERAEEIGALLARFHSSRVHGKFPDPCFVLDAYVDRGNRVWLLDFNVFAAATDSLLFSWEELHDTALALETDPASAAAEHATADPRQGATCIDAEAVDANGVSYTFQIRLTSDDSSKLVSDPMGQYRGPSDVELLATGGSSVDIDALRELMRRQE
eukprot:TRINITY_DN2037_c0_g1_i2.p1 TRINITY_DN2037_c0_g1~~TRINITY_DN2037_c0_g1_i2.p1  ORF type:complete len:347 (-),score=49.99 TRINITY_DN2037_c0_g1_i2:27-1067(-)